jgi:predicted amidophosphoribosyltransferase
MNKCRNCGVFVPVEKAFCPNCSEPIEPEEAPNRATTSSSDMMATMRDDPEHYKELLQALKKKPPTPTAAATAAQTPEAGAVSSAPPQSTQNAGYSAPQIAVPLPPVKSNNRSLFVIIGIFSLLVLIFVFLMVFRVF